MSTDAGKIATNDRPVEVFPQSQKFFRALIENSSDVIALVSRNGMFTYVSPSVTKILGFTSDDLLGRNTLDLFPPDQLTTALEKFEEVAKTPGLTVTVEHPYVHKDGSIRWLETTVTNHLNDPDIQAFVANFRDITERTQVEQVRNELLAQLQEANALLDTLFNKAPIGLGFWDHNLRYVRVNEALAEINGLPVKDHIGKTVGELLPQVDEVVMKTLRRVVEKGDSIVAQEVSGETPAVPEQRRYWSVSYYPVHLRGEIVGAGAICEEITENKRAEENQYFLAEVSKVLASSLDYKTTLANIAQLVVPQLADWFIVDLVDTNGNFELIEVGHKDPAKAQWARELRNKYPIDPEAPSGSVNVARTGTSELYPEVTDEMLAISARSEEELAIFRQLGFTSVMIVPLVARGKTLGVVTFVSTESRRKYDTVDVAVAEEVGRRAGVALDNAQLYKEVQEARDQLNVILQGVADGITVQDTGGKVIYANDVAAKIIGFPSVETMLEAAPSTFQKVLSRFEMRDEAGNPLASEQLPGRRALLGEQNVQAIVQYHDKETGHIRWSLVKAEPIFDEQGHVLFAVNVITDITEREELERRKDEFISMASHELKTPVTSLKGFTNVLQRRLTKQGDEQALHFLARMDGQLNKLTKLITDLLDISRMQTGKMTFREERFDLNKAIREIVENLQATTATHQLRLEETAHVRIIGDKDRIEQVLINLITNAIKYSPEADTVVIRVAKDQQHALVSVQDFGIGIAETHQHKIFERFYQVADPEEKTYPGLGIGLYISHQIIQRHHGRIWVKSRKGVGATFYFTLPLDM